MLSDEELDSYIFGDVLDLEDKRSLITKIEKLVQLGDRARKALEILEEKGQMPFSVPYLETLNNVTRVHNIQYIMHRAELTRDDFPGYTDLRIEIGNGLDTELNIVCQQLKIEIQNGSTVVTSMPTKAFNAGGLKFKKTHAIYESSIRVSPKNDTFLHHLVVEISRRLINCTSEHTLAEQLALQYEQCLQKWIREDYVVEWAKQIVAHHKIARVMES